MENPGSSRVHLILDEEDEANDAEFQRQTARASSAFSSVSSSGDGNDFNDALTAMRHVAHLAREIGSSVIKREACAVNQRLISVQERMHRQKRRKLDHQEKEDVGVDEAPPSSRSSSSVCKTTGKSQKGPKKEQALVSEQERASIWDQASRTKRMSLLLYNLETTHRLLMEEMIACAGQGASTRGGSGSRP